MNRITATTNAALLLCFALSVAHAADPSASPVRLVAEAKQEVVKTAPDGSTTREWVDIDRIVPGDTVVYIITAHNEGTEEITGIVLDDPIPADTEFVAGSAVAPNAEVRFSADGGDSFDAAESLTLVEEDGTTRLATNRDYTHIRFALNYPVGPGNTARVHFKTVVK